MTAWSYRSPAAPDEVWPTRVIGSSVAHLSTVELDDDGGRHRAICPAADSMGPLELVPDGAVIVWCGACRGWADVVGLELPRGR